jgi:hypothetical protein
MNRDLKELRRDYQAGELLEDDAGSDPLYCLRVGYMTHRAPVSWSPMR